MQTTAQELAEQVKVTRQEVTKLLELLDKVQAPAAKKTTARK